MIDDLGSFIAGMASAFGMSVCFVLFCIRFAKAHPPVTDETDGTELASNVIYAPPSYFTLNPRGRKC